jgi:hypothetical protein
VVNVLAAFDWERVSGIIIACSVLLGAVIVLGIGVALLRRYLRAEDAAPAGAELPWTLEDLEAMRRRGDLSESEYERMRETLVSAYRGEKPAPRPASTSARLRDDKKEHWDWVSPDFDLKKPPQG